MHYLGLIDNLSFDMKERDLNYVIHYDTKIQMNTLHLDEEAAIFIIRARAEIPLVNQIDQYFKILSKERVVEDDTPIFIYRIIVGPRKGVSKERARLPLVNTKNLNSRYLKESGLIDFSSKEVKELISKSRSYGGSNRYDILMGVLAVIDNTLQYSSDPPTVVDMPTLIKRGTGECHHYAALAITLLRARGVPARFVAGMMMEDGDEGNHAWIEVNLNGWDWIPVEPQNSSGAFRDDSLYFPIEVGGEYVDDESRMQNPILDYQNVKFQYDLEVIQE